MASNEHSIVNDNWNHYKHLTGELIEKIYLETILYVNE